MTRLAPLFLLPMLMAACANDAPPVEPYAFVGQWVCGAKVMTFTDTTYDSGGGPIPIRSVTRDGRNYTLTFDKGYLIALVAVTQTGLTWVSGKTGDQFNCRKL
ncbi:hypothetical protein [Tabrizicola sp. BL-A-41-H6]|uniref:hypothetical protein n=1 Tax=Tabrizicola sp. BL-A-41-H6 TaxID=3421107 RepID=UPI003D66569B